MTSNNDIGSTQAPINELMLSCLSSRSNRISFMTSLEMSFFRENVSSLIRTTTPLYWAVVANTWAPPRDSYEVALALARLSCKCYSSYFRFPVCKKRWQQMVVNSIEIFEVLWGSSKNRPQNMMSRVTEQLVIFYCA